MSIATCGSCGGTSLTWQTHNVIRVGCPVQQGRLNTNEVECLFVLGCDDCSETLAVCSADDIAKLLNNPPPCRHHEDAQCLGFSTK